MRKHASRSITAIGMGLALCMLFGACSDQKDQGPISAGLRSQEDAVYVPHDADRALQEEYRRQQEEAAMNMDRASEEIAQLRRDLTASRKETEALSQELQRTKTRASNLLVEKETSAAQIQHLSGRIERSKRELGDTKSLLEEWVVYAQALESQEKAYGDHIERQNKIIQDLASEQLETSDGAKIPSIPDRLVPTKSQAISRSKFFSIVQGMSLTELRRYLGSPDSVKGDPPEEYVYDRSLTYAFDENRKDSSVRVIIEDGTVVRCLFSE